MARSGRKKKTTKAQLKKKIEKIKRNHEAAAAFEDSPTKDEPEPEEQVILTNQEPQDQELIENKENINENIEIPTIENVIQTVPKNLRGYFAQRYSLFTKFDDGIALDDESWYSVTPEKIAEHIANRMKCDTVIDAFCGAGGNAIQFALTCKKVIAIDIDPRKLECARNNARIYGVEDKIEFIEGDSMQLLPTLKADAVFLSPPWGGPSYKNQDVFDLEDMTISGRAIFMAAKKVTDNICFYLPKNVGYDQLALMAGRNETIEIEKQFLNERQKCVSVYFGNLVGCPF